MADSKKMSWPLMLIIWIGLWAILLKVSSMVPLVSALGMALLAGLCSQGIYNIIQHLLPRQKIKNTKNRAVFITGCDSGFGAKLAEELHSLGYKVFAGCLFPNGDGAKALKLHAKSNPERLRVVKLDVTKEEEIVKAYHEVTENLHEDEYLWALVNNAGIAAITEIEWCPIEMYRRLLEVNAIGPITVTKNFLPLLRQNTGGRVIVVASLAGRYTMPGFSAYAMSKHAAVSFADALRLEMDKWGITVHTVEPTLYNTNIADFREVERSLDKLWLQCPEDVQNSYGDEYLNDFKESVSKRLSKARPTDCICEVIDDMVDAVAGMNPKTRYVPSFAVQVRAHLLSSLPTGVRDSLFLLNQPKTPPADVQKRRIPPYKMGRQNAKRSVSEPSREKSDFSPILSSSTGFKFPDTILPQTIDEIEEDISLSLKNSFNLPNNNLEKYISALNQHI